MPEPIDSEGTGGATRDGVPTKLTSTRGGGGSHRTRNMVLSVAVAAVLLSLAAYGVLTSVAPAKSGGVVKVVAAENFWGSLIAQIGGSHISVLSVVTDPNADPHEYSSNITDAKAIADARLVIVNGAGYDSWAVNLIAASNSPNQIVLNVAELLGKHEGENPHFWYDPSYVNQTVAQMLADLISVDKSDTQYFQQQYASLQSSLAMVDGRIAEIKNKFAGVHVASTESIFAYLANAASLDLVSPYAFMKAVAEGIDPAPADVATFYNQLESDNVSVLVYNAQTSTPLTESIKLNATQLHIPIVAVTETIQPPDVPFPTWMGSELINLENSLNQKALGH